MVRTFRVLRVPSVGRHTVRQLGKGTGALTNSTADDLHPKRRRNLVTCSIRALRAVIPELGLAMPTMLADINFQLSSAACG